MFRFSSFVLTAIGFVLFGLSAHAEELTLDQKIERCSQKTDGTDEDEAVRKTCLDEIKAACKAAKDVDCVEALTVLADNDEKYIAFARAAKAEAELKKLREQSAQSAPPQTASATATASTTPAASAPPPAQAPVAPAAPAASYGITAVPQVYGSMAPPMPILPQPSFQRPDRTKTVYGGRPFGVREEYVTQICGLQPADAYVFYLDNSSVSVVYGGGRVKTIPLDLNGDGLVSGEEVITDPATGVACVYIIINPGQWTNVRWQHFVRNQGQLVGEFADWLLVEDKSKDTRAGRRWSVLFEGHASN